MLSNSLFTENSESVVPESPRAEERDAVHSGSHMLSIACRISVRVGTPLHAGELPFVLPCSYQEGKQSELKASPPHPTPFLKSSNKERSCAIRSVGRRASVSEIQGSGQRHWKWLWCGFILITKLSGLKSPVLVLRFNRLAFQCYTAEKEE